MDRYLLIEILENRDYLDWRGLINQLNKEYHNRYYSDNMEVIKCQRCNYVLWNWRTSGWACGRSIINNHEGSIINNHEGLMKCHYGNDGAIVLKGVKLSKNYRL